MGKRQENAKIISELMYNALMIAEGLSIENILLRSGFIKIVPSCGGGKIAFPHALQDEQLIESLSDFINKHRK